MNERRSLHHSQSKVICRNVLELWLLKHRKMVMVFHAAENENRQLKELPQAYTGNVSVLLVGIWWRENKNKLVE